MRIRPLAEDEVETSTRDPISRRPDVSGKKVWDAVVYCLKVFVAMRVVLGLVALFGVALIPDLSRLQNAAQLGLPAIPGPVGVPGWAAHTISPGWHNLFTAWERFDALWFLKVAEQGYGLTDRSAVFFPLYPLLIRVVSFVIGGRPFAASLIVSNTALFSAMVLFYLLTKDELSEEEARRSVVYLAVFPTAFFLLAPYSESLFHFLTSAAILAARRGRWEMAGVAGALAALTRGVGVLLVILLVGEAIRQARDGRAGVPLRGFIWSLGPLAGAGSYLLYWGLRAGDWLAPLHSQEGWQRHLSDPLSALYRGTQEAFRWVGSYPGGYHMLDWMIAVPVLAAAGYALIRLPVSYSLYAWASIVLPLSFIFEPRPLMSFPRFAVVIFPIYWAAARWTAGHPLRHELVLCVSGVLAGLMLILFVNWYYVF